MVASVSGPRSLLVAGCGAQEGFLLRDQLPPQAEGPRPQLLSANPGAVNPRLGLLQLSPTAENSPIPRSSTASRPTRASSSSTREGPVEDSSVLYWISAGLCDLATPTGKTGRDATPRTN